VRNSQPNLLSPTGSSGPSISASFVSRLLSQHGPNLKSVLAWLAPMGSFSMFLNIEFLMAKKRTKKVKTPQKPQPETALVAVDTTHVNKRLRSLIKRSRTYYRKAQKEWEDYESEILPFYDDWISVSNSDFPSQIRELKGLYFVHKESLERADILSDMYDCSRAEGYARWIDQRDHPELYHEIYEDLNQAHDEADEAFFQQQQTGDFPGGFDEDMIHVLLPLHVEAVKQAFALKDLSADELLEFAREVIGPEMEAMTWKEIEHQIAEWLKKPTEDVVKRITQVREMWDESNQESLGHDTPQKKRKNMADSNGGPGDNNTGRQTYRQLVRSLHPDSADLDSIGLTEVDRQRLWVLVQNAWEAQDNEMLMVIQTQLQLKEPRDDLQQLDHTELQARLIYLRRALKSLRSTITRVKKENAWELFLMTPKARDQLRNDIRRDFEDDRIELSYHVDILNDQINLLKKKKYKKADIERFRRETKALAVKEAKQLRETYRNGFDPPGSDPSDFDPFGSMS